MRSHVLSFFFGLTLALLAPACPPMSQCSAATCSGCCDAAGTCQAGNGNLACGATGAQCTVCQGAQSCTFGVCGGAGAGGGNSGGTGGSGGGGSGGGGGTSNPTLLQFCLDATNAQADHYAACGEYSSAGIADQRAAQVARCNTTGGAVSAAYAGGRATFDATAAAACLSAIRAMTCTNTAPLGYETCYAVFPGAVAVGGACYSSSECTTAGYCNTSTSCPGQCVARLALGQPATSDEQCPPSSQAYGGVCTALIALGQSCAPTGGVTASHYCVSGATCNTANTCVTRVPTPLQGNGQPCNTSGLECGLGLTCIAGTCAPYATAGNPCDSVRRCQWDLTCSTANVCTAPAALGAACSPGTGTTCKSDLFCNRATGMTTGTCATRRTLDQPCTYSGSECVSTLFCTATATSMTGACKAAYALGAACPFDGPYQQCGERYCTATSTVPMGVCANKKVAGAACGSFQECQNAPCTAGVCGPPNYCSAPTP